MRLNDSQIEFLSSLPKLNVHGKNILAKKAHDKVSDFYEKYKVFHDAIKANVSLKGCVEALNKYKDAIAEPN